MLEPMEPFGQFDGTQMGVDHTLKLRSCEAATLAYKGAKWDTYAGIPLYLVCGAGVVLLTEVITRSSATPYMQQNAAMEKFEYMTAGFMLIGTVVCGALRERRRRLLRQAEALEPDVIRLLS
jgi:hypothetical protein